MRIREARAEDYEIVNPILVEVEHFHVSIEPEVFRPIDQYDPTHYYTLVNGVNTVILLAEADDGHVLGAAIASIRAFPAHDIFQDTRYVALEELTVTLSAQRMGVGRALMNAVEEWAGSHGIAKVHLSVWHSNAEAIAFYEALGYSPFLHQYHKTIKYTEKFNENAA